MAKAKDSKQIWFLKELGLEVTGESGNERICTCPRCCKEKHCHYNIKKGTYHCKICPAQGGYPRLLGELAKLHELDGASHRIKRLATKWCLPPEALLGYGIGWTGRFYILPVRNPDGKLTDLRRFKIGGKWQSAPGCKTGLFGAEQLAD